MTRMPDCARCHGRLTSASRYCRGCQLLKQGNRERRRGNNDHADSLIDDAVAWFHQHDPRVTFLIDEAG